LIGSSLIRPARTAQALSFLQDKVGANSAAPGGQEAQTLESGRSIEREIFGGQSHSYLTTLDAGKYPRVHVEQQGIDMMNWRPWRRVGRADTGFYVRRGGARAGQFVGC